MAPTSSNQDNNSQSPSTTLAADGDVILVVGGGNARVRLRVYSQCLKAASRVFSAMCSSQWREGQNLSSEQPPEVALPDDDPMIMRWICRILHYKEAVLTGLPQACNILNLAVHADKYDLMHILGNRIESWLDNAEPRTTEDRIYYFSSALLVDDSPAPRDWMFELVANHVGPYSDYMNEKLVKIGLDFANLYRLEEARVKLRVELSDLLRKRYKKPCSGKCSAPQPQADIAAYTKLYRTYTPLKMLNVPALEVMVKMKQIYTKDAAKDAYCRWEPTDRDCQCARELQAKLTELYDGVREHLIATPGQEEGAEK